MDSRARQGKSHQSQSGSRILLTLVHVLFAPGTGTDVGTVTPWLDPQDIHHALHLELLRAALCFEPREIAGLWWAGLTRMCLDSDRPLSARVPVESGAGPASDIANRTIVKS